jgi:hypothetical protein
LEEFAGRLDDDLMALNNTDDVAYCGKSLQTLNEDSGDQLYRYYRYESFLRLSDVRCEKYGGRSEDVVDGSAAARNSTPIKERHDQRLLRPGGHIVNQIF